MYELCFVFINCALIPFLDSALWLVAEGLATGYIDAREHSGGERHFDVDWSPIIEDLYSPELGNPLGCRGSACVEVMTTLHGSTPSLFEACRWLRTPEGTIASARDLLKSTHIHLEPPSPCRLSRRSSIRTPSLHEYRYVQSGFDFLDRVGGRLIRVSDQLDQRSDQRDMDSQIVTVDQFAEAMASIQEAIASLGRRIDGQQAQQVPPSDGAHSDRGCSASRHRATPTSEDPHARMDRLEQGLRQLRTSDRAITWEDFDGAPVASLPAKFRMPEIERYTGIGCPASILRLYSTIMRAHGLDGAQMIMLFPMSLGGAAQRWFASLDVSRRRTWDDLAQEFLRQYAFNTVADVSRRELEALRQRSDESISSFISRWRGKIPEIVDRPSKKDQIQMVLRSLQPRIARHVVGVLLQIWISGSGFVPPVRGPPGVISLSHSFSRLVHLTCLSSTGHGAPHPTYDQTYQPQPLALPYYATQSIERPPISYTATGQPCYAAQFIARPATSYPRPRAQQTSTPFALRTQRQFSQIGHVVEPGSSEAHRGWVIDYSHPSATASADSTSACRSGFDRPGFGTLGQPSVTTNPLPAHTTHAVPPPADGIHFLEFDEIDDHIHMLSDDDPDLEPIMPDAATVEPLILPRYSVQTPFVLVLDVEEFQAPHSDDPQTPDVQYILRGGRVLRQPPPAAAARPLGGTSS
ncbi:hypothetical protein CK203_058917 [Vitis vinifera]|uniref:Retrotransposon gag domain-containing protein n=1 Tax=Vitis vinifera TaxID=29760 RepID=A0A438FS44_VITVI|nr:hypothetical protein CK203_058917 [Vitis vinifera]